jgi:hypothetical protein
MKKALLVVTIIVVLAVTVIPVNPWCIPGNPSPGDDNKFEQFGPHIKGINIPIFANLAAELTAMQNNMLDLEDMPLPLPWIALWTGDPRFTLQTYSGGVKAYRNTPIEEPQGPNWAQIVNEVGIGVNSWWTTLNMMKTCEYYPPIYVHYGFSQDVSMLNPVYATTFWDWEVMGRIYDYGARRNPYDNMTWVPQLYKYWDNETYVHPIYGVCSKVRITLRSDLYWQDGTPLTMADVHYTLIEMAQNLIAKGLPPPVWYNPRFIDVCQIDPYNFEILLDINSPSAVDWVLSNVILPKHIWKPIVDASTPMNPIVQGFQPDRNLIGSGPFRFNTYIPGVGGVIVLEANTPGSIVRDIRSPGYWQYCPVHVNVHTLLLFENITALTFPKIELYSLLPIDPMNPVCTLWVDPTTVLQWHCVFYERDWPPPGLSYSDILVFELVGAVPQKTIEVHVLEAIPNPVGGYTIIGEVIDAPINPVGTLWHMVKPYLSYVFNVTDWKDNGDGVVDQCDWLLLKCLNTTLPPCFSTEKWYHVFLVEKVVPVVPPPVPWQPQYLLKVDYMNDKLNLPHASGQLPPPNATLPVEFGIELQNLWLNDSNGGYLIVNKYVYIDGNLLPGYPEDVILYTAPNGTILHDKEEINYVFPKCCHNITVAVHVKGPPMLDPIHDNPWISQWINVTLRIWITVIEDLIGNTFYDIIGLPRYPYKTELTAPDCKVNIIDILATAKAFGSYPGNPRWLPPDNVNKDYKIDIIDLLIEIKEFGFDP